MNKGQGYKRILIVRMDRVGDLVLSTPAIKAVRDAYPESHIAVLVRPYSFDVISGNPNINEVITYDKGKEGRGIFGNIKFIFGLRKKKFDLAIILHPKNSSHLFTFLAGIPERIGYDKKLGILLTKKVPHTKQFGLKHEIDYTFDLLRYIGVDPKASDLYMPLSKESEKKISDIFAKNGITEKDVVITVNPGASCVSKRWSYERFASASDALINKFDAKIIIISGPEDKIFADRTAALIKKGAINMGGKTSISDLASILKRSKLFISNDSGPVHIACALGIPVISIFGRSDRGLSPRRWGSVGKRDIVLHKDVGCEVCLAHKCKRGFACLQAISVDDVLAAAERILGER